MWATPVGSFTHSTLPYNRSRLSTLQYCINLWIFSHHQNRTLLSILMVYWKPQFNHHQPRYLLLLMTNCYCRHQDHQKLTSLTLHWYQLYQLDISAAVSLLESEPSTTLGKQHNSWQSSRKDSKKNDRRDDQL